MDLVTFGRNRHLLLLLLLLGPCQGNHELLLFEPCPKLDRSGWTVSFPNVQVSSSTQNLYTQQVTSKSSVRCLEFLLLLLLLLVGTRRVTLSRCLKEASLHTPFYLVLEEEYSWW